MLVLVMDAESSLEPCLEPKGKQEEEELNHKERKVTENRKELTGNGKTSICIDKLNFLKFNLVLFKFFF